jgi:mannose/fructose/N-acetylgalactosamine-specific phosphotransferase system component IIC
MTARTSHLGRDVAAIIAGILALSVAGWILVGFGFALIIAMMTIVAAAVVIPFVVIYYEERELPRDGRPT